MPTPLSPPTPTLLLANLPPSSLLGIDLLTLTTPKAPRTFSGIKDLPPGPHFLFTAETPSHSLRSGFWFFVPPLSSSAPPPLILRVWSAESISLVPCDPESIDGAEHVARLSREGQMVYQQGENDNGEWSRLTPHITPILLSRLFGNMEDWTITTSSCSAQDRDDIPGLTTSEAREGQERELYMLGIDLKRTWREGAVGRERTEGALDRSWALEDLVTRLDDYATTTTSEGNHDEEEGEGVTREKEWGSLVLGEMEISFLMTLTLSNYSCLEEWKRILGLVLTCSSLLRSRPNFFTAFLRLLQCQLRSADNTIEGGLFSLSGEGEGGYLKSLIKTFRRTVSSTVEDMIDEAPDKILVKNKEGDEDDGGGGGIDEIEAAMKDLESWVRDRYGWKFGGWFVRRGGLVLEDGEVVEMEVDVDELDELDDAGFFAAAGGGGY